MLRTALAALAAIFLTLPATAASATTIGGSALYAPVDDASLTALVESIERAPGTTISDPEMIDGVLCERYTVTAPIGLPSMFEFGGCWEVLSSFPHSDLWGCSEVGTNCDVSADGVPVVALDCGTPAQMLVDVVNGDPVLVTVTYFIPCPGSPQEDSLSGSSLLPPVAPVARITVEETLTGLSENGLDAEYDFDQFDPANGTLTSIQVGIKIAKEYEYTMTNSTGTNKTFGSGVANGTSGWPYGFDVYDVGKTQGSNYQRVVMSRDGEYSFAHSLYHPLQLTQIPAGNSAVLLLEDAETDYTWSTTITDASVLSAHTGTGTVKVSFDTNYLHTTSGSQAYSLDHTMAVEAAIRYNY